MKKLFLSLVLLPLLSCTAPALEFGIGDLSGGMWSDPSANRIPDNAAPLIRNFYTDVEPIAIERNGYARKDSTLLGDTKAVTGLWEFTDSNGLLHIVSFSSRTYYQNVPGDAPVVLGTVTTVAQIPNATVTLGRIWFVNGTGSLWWYDGASTGIVSGAPLGTLIVSWRDRLVIGNIGSAQTTLRFSADGDGESWTLAGNPTDPFALTIGGANDGLPVTCMWSTYIDNLIIARKTSLFSISGFDQADVVTREISSEIGCIHNGSMREFDGSLLFMSNRGMEEMRGRSIKNISEPVRDLIEVVVQNTASNRSDVYTTGADWNGATQFHNLTRATSTLVGSLHSIFPDEFSVLRDGTGGEVDVWEDYIPKRDIGNCGVLQSEGTVTSDGDDLVLTGKAIECDGTASRLSTVAQTKEVFISTTSLNNGVTIQFVIESMDTDSSQPSRFYFGLNNTQCNEDPDSQSTIAGGICSSVESLPGEFWFYRFLSSETGKVALEHAGNNEASDSADDLRTSSPSITLPVTVQFFLNSTNFNLTIGGTLNKSNTHAWGTGGSAGSYFFFGFNPQPVPGKLEEVQVDDLLIIHSSQVYVSSVIDIGTDASAWRQFSLNETQNGQSVVTYEFNSSPNSASFDNSSWTAIVEGQIATNTVNQFNLVRITFDTPTMTNWATVEDFTIRWFEGDAPPVQSWEHDRRYWLAFSTKSGGGPVNDSVLVYQRNRTWSLLKGINAASFATWQDDLYFGNSDATGLVYQFGDGNNDDGSDINSEIIFKSYDVGLFNQDKDFRQVYANFKSGASGSFSLSYQLDRDGNTFSLGSAGLTEETGQVNAKFPFPLSNPVQGREIQYTLNKSGTGDRLKLYDLKTEYMVIEAR